MMKYTEKFFTNGRYTVCILTPKSSMEFCDEVMRALVIELNGKVPPSINYPKEFKGISKLHPDDNFDPKIGKDIAKKRAYAKAQKWEINFSKRMKEMENELDFSISGVNQNK